jgi:hypothetical protein
LADSESLGRLLRVASLRSVSFRCFYFTHARCQATANALMEGTAITSVEFTECSFSTGECAVMMANGLSRKTSVSHIKVASPLDQALCSALATALPSNSTLRCLILQRNDHDDDHDLSRVFLALGNNAGLKTLTIDNFGLMIESLCIAIKDGLGENETLESLELANIVVNDDNIALWCRAFSFLRTNKALKSLMLSVNFDTTKLCLSVFRIDIVTMLQENASLESLSIDHEYLIEIKAEEYFVLVTTLQHNRTLKTLSLGRNGSFTLTHDEGKQMAALLQKNYALETLPGIDLENEAGDVGAILRLNEAGRRYLIEDGSSISKGVEVLSSVSDEINCVFLHLLENPRLCDRSAVEAASDSESADIDESTSRIGKREHGRAQNESKEARRRMT